MTQNNWREVKLGDVCDVIGGGTPKTSVAEYWNGDIPWLSVVDFNNENRWVKITEKSITETGLKNSSTKILTSGQVIISARGTVGALAQVFSNMAFNQSCYGLNGKKTTCINDFLYYLVKFKINELKNITHGSVFDTITRDTFNNIEVYLPPLDIQEKIAGVLSVLDDKIELNNQINENLEAQAMAIFKSWFVDFEKTNGSSKLGDFITILKGKNITKKTITEGNIPVVAGGLSPAYYHNVANTKSPTVTVSASGANAGFVNIYYKNIWASDCSYLDINSSKYVYFIYLLFKIRQGDIYRMQTGCAQPHVYPKNLMELSIPNIDYKKLDEFTELIKPFFNKIAAICFENEHLAQLRDTLLPKLMNGEIDVSEININKLMENK